MIYRTIKIAMIFVIIVATTLQYGCAKSIHQYIAQVGDATESFVDGVGTLYSTGTISKDLYTKCLDAAEQSNKRTDEFKQLVLQYKQITSSNSLTLQDKIHAAASSFSSIVVSEISDASKRQQLQALINTILLAFDSINLALSKIKNPLPAQKVISMDDIKYIDHRVADINSIISTCRDNVLQHSY